jgi:hypothetical protein
MARCKAACRRAPRTVAPASVTRLPYGILDRVGKKDAPGGHACRLSSGDAVRPLPSGGQGPGHFPTEQAALKCLYLVTRSLDPTGKGRARWAMRWKPALNAFAVTFAERFPAAETY